MSEYEIEEAFCDWLNSTDISDFAQEEMEAAFKAGYELSQKSIEFLEEQLRISNRMLSVARKQ